MMNAPDNTGWAQIGYFRSVGSLRFFWQYMKDNSVPQSQRVTATYFWGDPVVGDMKRFKVERTGGGGHIHMFLGNNEAPCKPSGECPETPFDPLNAWNGTESQWYGETGWGGSDMPGVVGAKVDFDSLRVKISKVTQTYAGGSNKCFYHMTTVDPQTHFRIWTDPLNHNC